MSRFNYIANKCGQRLKVTFDNDVSITDIGELSELDIVKIFAKGFDPSANNKYTQWIIKQYIASSFLYEDAGRVYDELNQFESIKYKLAKEQRDINKYNYRQFSQLLQSIFGKDVELEIDTSDPELDVLYNGPLGLLVSPKTEAASCKAGSGTKWCTAANKNNAFKHYNKSGPLYIWKDKSGEKYQFHFETGQYMDAQDCRVCINNWFTTHPVLTKLVESVIDKFKSEVRCAQLIELYQTLERPLPWLDVEELLLNHADISLPTMSRYASLKSVPWPEAEKFLLKAPATAFSYVVDNIKGPWPAAEKSIVQSGGYCIAYASQILRGRFPLGEQRLLTTANSAQISVYLHDVVKGRWSEYEEVLLTQTRDHRYYYSTERKVGLCVRILDYCLSNYINFRWEEVESFLMYPIIKWHELSIIRGKPGIIMQDLYIGKLIAYIIKYNLKRVYELEKYLLTYLTSYTHRYAVRVVKCRWPEYENALLVDSSQIRYNLRHAYHNDIMKKGPWPEAELDLKSPI